MKKIVFKEIPTETIAQGIRIHCRNGIEYRNIVKGQAEYELPDSVDAVAAFAYTKVELLNV